MKNKYYNLTEKPNQGKQDQAPDWMNSVFEKKAETPKEDFSQLFKKPDKKVKKCSICGMVLNDNEVGYCKNCQ